GGRVCMQRHRATGSLRAKRTDIFVGPAIQPNSLARELAQRALVGGIRLARRLLGTPQLSRFVDRETFPGDGVRTDDEVLHWARQYGGTVWHLVGTCRMGPAADKSSVVSDALRVHGLQNLRVVDASVMPSMPSANTYSATMVVAEKGSDLIRGQAAPAPVALPA